MTKKPFLLSPQRLVSGPRGPRTLACSVDYCTRCNACVQSCPSYLLHREEAFSPRGRNQILRLLLEGKIKPSDNEPLLKRTFFSCQLCARCSAACAGELPVAEHVLALRRAGGWSSMPRLLVYFMRLYGAHPLVFDKIISGILLLRRAGILGLLRISGVLSLPFLRWGAHAHTILPHSLRTLRTVLKKQKTALTPDNPQRIYLPSFEAQYADANIGLYTLQLLKDKPAHILLAQPSGLFEYLYGSETISLTQAKNLLTRWEKLSARRKLPLVTDGLETYLFLKHYPLLFASLPGWQKRAEDFAAQVKYIAELPLCKTGPARTTNAKTGLDISSVLYPSDTIAERTRKILKTHLGKNFVECEYSRFVLPVAGSAFAEGYCAREVTLENVKDVSRQQLEQVYCLSGWAALELDAALRRHYPQARARHWIYVQAEP